MASSSTFSISSSCLNHQYFQSGYHFPLRYFVYIGITAIIRLIIVDHKNPFDTLAYAIAILILVITLWLANTNRLKRE